jgi:aryl-alcohol dehydrogenase
MTVFGAGAVGLAAVMADRIAGCSTIVVTDLHRSRLDLALELGATQVHESAPDITEHIVRSTGGGTDFAVDAVGLPQTVAAALGTLVTGGAAAVVGSAGTGQAIPIDLTTLMTRSIHGVLEGDSVPAIMIPQLVSWYAAGLFPFDRVVSRYPINEINAAVADAERGTTIKPILIHDPG